MKDSLTHVLKDLEANTYFYDPAMGWSEDIQKAKRYTREMAIEGANYYCRWATVKRNVAAVKYQEELKKEGLK